MLILIGTQARSGLVCLILLIGFAIWYSKQKAKILGVALILPLLLLPLAHRMVDRMSTIQSKDTVATEASAMGRVVVWRWAIDYFKDNPFTGGGFLSYRLMLKN